MAPGCESINARARRSSSAFTCSAITITGIVAVIPWLPDPELLIAGNAAPPIRASEAAEVRTIISVEISLASNPFSHCFFNVLPICRPHEFLRPSRESSPFSLAASRMKRIASKGTLFINLNMGLSHYAITSYGAKVYNPRHLINVSCNRNANKKSSPVKKGNMKCKKTRVRLAALQERVANAVLIFNASPLVQLSTESR